MSRFDPMDAPRVYFEIAGAIRTMESLVTAAAENTADDDDENRVGRYEDVARAAVMLRARLRELEAAGMPSEIEHSLMQAEAVITATGTLAALHATGASKSIPTNLAMPDEFVSAMLMLITMEWARWRDHEIAAQWETLAAAHAKILDAVRGEVDHADA